MDIMSTSVMIECLFKSININSCTSPLLVSFQRFVIQPTLRQFSILGHPGQQFALVSILISSLLIMKQKKFFWKEALNQANLPCCFVYNICFLYRRLTKNSAIKLLIHNSVAYLVFFEEINRVLLINVSAAFFYVYSTSYSSPFQVVIYLLYAF
jgi:hypothetical protein